eukprot:3642420-Pleurochrysis_carterae.AAC.1
MSMLRKGPGFMESAITHKDWNATARAARAAEVSSSRSEAIKWWTTMLSMWDAVPNEFVIVHPRLIWDNLYVSVLLK